ncbi:MAG TPA: saccharopine dehydrogenase family protein [Conexivisphaerales archaeon]|nr:saccharopine dehydrogenase family protein [Conexivisphaerales archaeon]
MKAAVLGAGGIGSVAARDFASSLPDWQVTLADLDLARAKSVSTAHRGGNLVAARLDAASGEGMVSFLKGFDLVLSALPGSVGFAAAGACVEAGTDLVDVSFSPEDPFLLDDMARSRGSLLVPDCGVAPGLSNALVGRAVAQLDEVDSVHVMVGGLPVEPSPPLGYVVTWSVEGLIDEYTRKARLIDNGRMKEVDALTGVERIDFPGVGPLDAFLTDGARTLFRTVPRVREMWEKTLRYPGHVEVMSALRDLGLFDEKPREVDGVEVVPRRLTARLLEETLRVPGAEDLLAMRVEVSGRGGGTHRRFENFVLDYFDRATGTTAMARTTAFTASVVAQQVAMGNIEGSGVLTPEEIGMKADAFDRLIQGLGARGVRVR